MSRRQVTLSAATGLSLLAVSACLHFTPLFIWNASASAPIGLYRLVLSTPISIGDLVVVTPPAPLDSFLADRGYLPRSVPLLKRIVALGGTTVCRIGLTMVVDGHITGTALARDSHDRPLPVWQGCRTLADDDVFLMNSDVADSLDGRYFGPLPVSAIVARALPMWTNDGRNGRFEWHLADPSVVP
ncbi:MAG: hypothetical protein BGO82_05380 [Devosia sp. 67-54]|uniref:S26 family signal peptidase n=1 Tax=unclassified Devosia TaxID=196773 RepID=UPI00086B30E3|nr:MULTISPECIES: S26 family signal peptidase [unclassified Devosia]MBN9306953.1 S26 family signal peptidase [Devosia sp.]ODU58599.1 MAG: hypothetical protein ABS99_04245 [Acetobacteraceae bacterium SCN 69-10]OJX16955.1 MAG: hypothetical protein BGO82_05380 [Devosia sp. 67-54]